MDTDFNFDPSDPPKNCPQCASSNIKSKVKRFQVDPQGNSYMVMCKNEKCPWPFSVKSPADVIVSGPLTGLVKDKTLSPTSKYLNFSIDILQSDATFDLAAVNDRLSDDVDPNELGQTLEEITASDKLVSPDTSMKWELNTDEDMAKKFKTLTTNLDKIDSSVGFEVNVDSDIRPGQLENNSQIGMYDENKERSISNTGDTEEYVNVNQIILEPAETLSVLESMRGTHATTTLSRLDSDSSKKVNCEVDGCTFKCSSKSHLTRHKLKVHKREKFECPNCGRIFGHQQNLDSHIDIVHKQIKKYKCVKCDSSFGYKHHLKRHVKVVHEKKPQPYTCFICNDSFSNVGLKKVHDEIVHKKKLFSCSWKGCTWTSTEEYRVKFHVRRVHTFEWNLLCDICEGKDITWGCIFPYELRKHKMEKHASDNSHEEQELSDISFGYSMDSECDIQRGQLIQSILEGLEEL